MSVEELMEQVKQLSREEKTKLLRLLNKDIGTSDNLFDPLEKYIASFDGPGTGSIRYKKDLYGDNKGHV